jgi:hypothetical protein
MKLSSLKTPVGILLIVVGLLLERNSAVDAARIKQCEKSVKLFVGPFVQIKCLLKDDRIYMKAKSILTQEEVTYDEQGQRVE